MSRYQKNDLIKEFIKDIYRIIVPRKVVGIGGIVTTNLVSNIELSNNYIKFVLSADAIKLMRTVDDYNIKDYLSSFNKMWKDRVFEGTNGYYIFGDIIKSWLIEIIAEKIKSLRFPFYKIEYHSYLDNMLEEVKFTLISYLDFDSINNMNFLYEKFTNDNIFLLLISKDYPNFYKILMTVYSDLKNVGKYKYITLQDLYATLKEIKNVEKVSMETITKKSHLELYSVSDSIYDKFKVYDVLSYYIAKMKYPYIYGKILQIPQIGNIGYDMTYLENLPESELLNYFKTGNIPPTLTKDIVYLYDSYLIHLLLLDDIRLEFSSYSDYLITLVYITYGLYYNFLFDKLGIAELVKITETPKPDDISETVFNMLMSKIIDYISEKGGSYIKDFGTERLVNLIDKYKK